MLLPRAASPQQPSEVDTFKEKKRKKKPLKQYPGNASPIPDPAHAQSPSRPVTSRDSHLAAPQDDSCASQLLLSCFYFAGLLAILSAGPILVLLASLHYHPASSVSETSSLHYHPASSASESALARAMLQRGAARQREAGFRKLPSRGSSSKEPSEADVSPGFLELPPFLEPRSAAGQLASSLLGVMARTLYQKILQEPSTANDLILHLAAQSVAAATRADAAYLSHVGNNATLQKYRLALFMNVLHAISWGYPFILDQMPPPPDKPLPDGLPHYGKILALQRHVSKFGAIVWLDADIIILDESDLVHRILFEDAVLAQSELIIPDHSYDLCNAMFFLRNSNWTRQFLRRWWDKAQPGNFFSQDQNPMHLVLVEEMERDLPRSKNVSHRCPAPKECEYEDGQGREHVCMNRHFACRGHPYNRRLNIGRFSGLPQNVSRYRMTRWFMHSPAPKWTQEDMYREGDLTVHTKDQDEFLGQRQGLVEARIKRALGRLHLDLCHQT